MDFIEQIFGLSPDGGSGATELMYLAAFVAIVAALSLWRVRHRASQKSRD